MHQKELLSTEAERMRRLEEVPEITAETEPDENETEHEVAASNSPQDNRGAAEDLGNTNTFLPPLSVGVKK